MTSQRRRSSAALRTTGREPERPRREAIDDMSMAAAAAAGGSMGIGAEREAVWAFGAGENGGQIYEVGFADLGILLAGEGDGGRREFASLSRLLCFRGFCADSVCLTGLRMMVWPVYLHPGPHIYMGRDWGLPKQGLNVFFLEKMMAYVSRTQIILVDNINNLSVSVYKTF